MANEYFNAVGRRKTSIARVFLKKGTGTITVNKRDMNNYFPRKSQIMKLKQPLVVTDSEGKYDIYVTVDGGGLTGQTEAIRLGIARALIAADQTNRSTLKKNGFLTRDSRMVERKKYGQPGARRKFQFSKR